MGTIIGYARVSTKDQDLTVQLEQLKAAGCTKIYQEKVSGSKLARPELTKMLEYAREGEDTIVVCKLDRIARSIKDLWNIVDGLTAKNIGFKVLNNAELDTTSATGRMMLSILGAVAQFEREMLLERQAEGIAIAKQKGGVYVGRQPTAVKQTAEVKRLLAEGKSKLEVANILGIGKSSVYRIAAAEGV
jgi:DNA invertase Pin-like site-specific DNA recombinase